MAFKNLFILLGQRAEAAGTEAAARADALEQQAAERSQVAARNEAHAEVWHGVKLPK